MDETLTLEPNAEERAELASAIQEMFAQMEKADRRIQRHQEHINTLKAETRAMLADLKAA